jgi:radical SAM protein with 4Fe4S-binding SPASM domain
MCPQKAMSRPRGEMSLSVFHKIADEVAKKGKNSKLWVAIMGEPFTTRRQIINMIEYAKDVGVKSVNLNTNGVLMTSTRCREVIESGLDTILIGIDAYTEETYNKIRIGGNFEAVIVNTEMLLKLKTYVGAKKPKVIVQFIVMKENEHEVEAFKKFWLQRGAIVKIRPRLGWGTGVSADNLDLTEAERTYPCPWLTRTVSITWNGKFNQCDGDYDGKYSPGDINKESIEDVWKGEMAKRQAKHWQGDFSADLCSKCKDWQVAKAKFYYPRRNK